MQKSDVAREAEAFWLEDPLPGGRLAAEGEQAGGQGELQFVGARWLGAEALEAHIVCRRAHTLRPALQCKRRAVRGVVRALPSPLLSAGATAARRPQLNPAAAVLSSVVLCGVVVVVVVGGSGGGGNVGGVVTGSSSANEIERDRARAQGIGGSAQALQQARE